MGEINDKLCKLLGTKEYFADFWNGAVWTRGETLDPAMLSRDDKEYYKFLEKSSGIRRDVLMKLRGRSSSKLGIEIMETIDYSMPARLMDYDAQEIKRQLNDIAIMNRQLAELELISWEHSGEFLYGVRLEDRILPVMTVALYCGWEEYDGADGILGMSRMDEMPQNYKEQFQDYRMRLYSLKGLDETRFETGLRELVAIFKRSRDRDAMKAYFEAHKERFKLLDAMVIDAMGALIGRAKLKLFKQEGRGLDLCKAFEDEREEGKQLGIQVGTERVNQLIRYLIRDKRNDEIERVVSDMAYQGTVLREYGLV